MSCFKNALIFGDQNFSSGDHFTKESRQKATSEKLELEALFNNKLNHNFTIEDIQHCYQESSKYRFKI